MDSIREWRKNAYHRRDRPNAAFVGNGELVASCSNNLVAVSRLGVEDNGEVWSIAVHSYGRPTLSLSQVCSKRLAISIGSRTVVYDLPSKLPIATLISNERTITSTAWSGHDGDVLATGHVDGRICIWDVKQVSQPMLTLSTGMRPCHQLAWNTDRPEVLAVSAGQLWQLWQIGSRSRALSAECDVGAKIKQIQWRPHAKGTLLTLDVEGDVTIWDVSDIPENASSEPEDDAEDSLFGEPEDVYPDQLPTRTQCFDSRVMHAAYIGTSGLLLLAEQGRTLQLFDVSHMPETFQELLWQEDLELSMDHVEPALNNGDATVILFGHAARLTSVIPSRICERLEAQTRSSLLGLEGSSTATGPKKTETIPSTNTSGYMKPDTISDIRAERANFSKTAKQLQYRRRSSHPSPTSRPTTSVYRESPATAIPATPPSKAITSSLELPKLEADDSPMPFLSPTIPSRKPSPTAISPLDENLHLPSLTHESFESLATSPANDSDSDDETFDGHDMHGSSNLNVPGSVNVPLPKSCGALFAPNGQLVTYFPPQLRLRTAKTNVLALGENREQSAKALGLFPVFGNLQNRIRHADESSDSESLGSWDEVAVSDIPGIDLQPPSFPGTDVWPTKLASAKSTIHRSPSQQTVNVSVRNIDATSLRGPSRAENYRILCRTGETGADVCMANADISKTAGSGEDAEIWRLLTRLLSNDAPANKSGLNHDGPAVANANGYLVRSDSGIELRPFNEKPAVHGIFRSSDSTTERLWTVDELFEWAEKRADVQMLACMSAVLISADPTAVRREPRAELSFASKLATNDPSRFTKQQSPTKASTQARPVPVLRNDSRDFFHQSPVKLPQTSHTSSRNPSQPTTPYLESLSSTPPFHFPNLSRQGSRMSTSGSASPEHHRSSFSAAAKYYAQSITEKFSSYGTSPPTKRLGTSPGNELSSSLPTGSWTKSVSFASTVDTTRNSAQSKGIPMNEDDYDSDRTVEDLSILQAPRTPTGPLFMKVKRSDSFASDITAQSKVALMSPKLAAKAQLWMGYYAEQLRCWDMLIEAAELEKIAGISLEKPAVPRHQGVFPVPAIGRRKATCSVCFCKIESIEHVCAQCLHTMHLSCLQNFVDACEPDEFECPTGCGCVCSLAIYREVVWEEPAAQPERRAADRRWSATDPRVWRAKIESDSW